MGWLYLYGPAVAAVALVAAIWLWHPVRVRLTERRNRDHWQ